MPLDFIKFAIDVFADTKHQASDADIQKLASNARILESRGMSKLNRRLSEGGRKVRDTLAEHRFAVNLVSYHKQSVKISYEPDEDGLRRPPDFKIVSDDLTYWVQMKRLSNLERENRQNKIIQKIRSGAKEIAVGVFFGCDLSEHFSEKDVPALIDFLATKSSNPEEGKNYGFPSEENPKAIVEFWYPNRSEISSLTLGISSDMDVIEETGLAKEQIKKSLKKAARAFEWDVNQNTINLIAMDADKHEDIDICDAIFGTEFEIFSQNRHSWSREKDGFFLLPDFLNKVAGVIVLKSKERSPVSDYLATLYINDIFKNRCNNFDKLLTFSNVIHFKMRPPMGKGNFDIS